MSQVSLKEKEISQLAQEKNKLAQEKNQLLQEKNQLDKTNKERQEKINKLKDRLIESLQKKLKGVPLDHPQTEEIVVIQAEKEELQKEVMELKAKVL